MNVNGGDVENVMVIDYILYFILFFWKVEFSKIQELMYQGVYIFRSVLFFILFKRVVFF